MSPTELEEWNGKAPEVEEGVDASWGQGQAGGSTEDCDETIGNTERFQPDEEEDARMTTDLADDPFSETPPESTQAARQPRTLRAPKRPTEQIVLEHESMGHAVYRSWCNACVRASGQEAPHRRGRGQEYSVPQLCGDYWFIGGTVEDREDHAVLTLWEKTSAALFGDVVAQKGVTSLVVEQVAWYLESLGFRRVVCKTDSERPITALMRAVKLQ